MMISDTYHHRVLGRILIGVKWLTVAAEKVVSVDPLDPILYIPAPVSRITVPPGVIAFGSIGDAFERAVGDKLCTNTTFTTNFGGESGSGYLLGVCHTVFSDSVINVRYSHTAIVLRPPSGYCLRLDNLPFRAEINFMNSVTFVYERSIDGFTTITCSDDTLHILGTPRPTDVNITLVTIGCQATYGQTYDIDGLSIFQYPPILSDIAIRSYNVTGAVTVLEIIQPLYTLAYFQPSSLNNHLFDRSASRTIAVVTGRGQLTTNLGTSAGVNAGYDETYQSIEKCSLSPSEETSSSSVVVPTDDTSTDDDSTSIDETSYEVAPTDDSSSSRATSSVSPDITSSSVSESISVTDDNTGFVVGGTFDDAATSKSPSGALTSSAAGFNASLLIIAITIMLSMFP
ncbi:hypothetical protein PROFUN_13062 [Planoprotostelium fungivorum]|uniref:Uncharacterized protein n=1 Tax=Planoprotostelium fungivorum TaxID=1890364 RepID=A0A2P6N5F8_9EUKA|nr:hypothetical protein PROFUN_13062 [Planoprotostelium fungivorum]